MKDFVLKIVQQLIDHPDDVAVSETADENGSLISFSVNPEDMGKVIGKSGRIIKSLRDLVRVKSIKSGVRTNLSLLENPGQTG